MTFDGPVISTWMGRAFNFIEPDPDSICIEDIAHSLSLLCRYNGHTPTHYSVAEHSIRCSYEVPHEFAKQALMHDAAEAYIGDVASPLKALLPDFQRIEEAVEDAVAVAFDLPAYLHPLVKEADLRMLATEKRDILFKDDEEWPVLKDIHPFPDRIFPLRAREAEFGFLRRWEAVK